MSTQPTVPTPAVPPVAATPTATPVATPAPVTQSSEPKSINQRIGDAFKAAQEKIPSDADPNLPVVATQEQPTPADTPAEPTPEVTEAVDPNAPKDAAPSEPEEIDDGSSLGPKSFADWVNKEQAVKEALAKPENAALRAHLFGALRRDEENRELRAYVPDVETAKAMSEGAGNFKAFDNLFLAAEKPEQAAGFLDRMGMMALFVDDQGKPIMKDGQYQYHPALKNIFNAIYEPIHQQKFAALRSNIKAGKLTGDANVIVTDTLAMLSDQAQKQGNDELLAAIDLTRAAIPAVAPAQAELPPELKERDAAIRKREEEHAKRETEQYRALHSQSQERSEKSASDSIVASLKPILDKVGLQGELRATVAQRIIDQLDEFVEAQPYYTATAESILSKPPGEAREKEHTAHILRFYNQGIKLGKITAETIAKFTQPVLQAQDDKDAKRAQQAVDSRGDRSAPNAAAGRQGAKTPEQMRADVTKDLGAGATPEAIRKEMIRRSLLNAGMPA